MMMESELCSFETKYIANVDSFVLEMLEIMQQIINAVFSSRLNEFNVSQIDFVFYYLLI